MTTEATPGDRATLLQEIAHCPVAAACIGAPRGAHPCTKVVMYQEQHTLDGFQVPEPWSGHIETAPVLFVSSNPSIAYDDLFPRWFAQTESLDAYFQERFEKHIRDGIHVRLTEGSRADARLLGCTDTAAEQQNERSAVQWGKSVQFWAGVKGRARELFDRPVRPGTDYALTEVVHCKTRSEVGVPEAKFACAERYLARVLACSPARVIVVLGVAALPGMQRVFPEATVGRGVRGPLSLAGHERYVVYLPHPNAFETKTFAGMYPEELPRLRAYLTQGEAHDAN